MFNQLLKVIYYFLALIIISLILYGCFLMPNFWGSGYIVKITINNHQKVKNTCRLEKYLKKEKFIKKNKDNDLSTNVRYSKQLTTGWINLLISYRDDGSSVKIDRVIIGNRNIGYQKSVKLEIDRIANDIYEELKRCAGEQNIDVKRERTSLGI